VSRTNWIEEQKEIDGFFSGRGRTSDADKLLEKSPGNRNIDKRQGKLFILGRSMGESLGISCLAELCDDAEYAQMCIEKDSRKDFMKVAIEQFYGKLQASKSKLGEALSKAL